MAENYVKKIKNFSNLMFAFFVFLFLIILFSIFLSKALASDRSPDAIAIRIIPNPNHYSALRWYREQGFNGAPQSLTVDGYEAVRDGRTVYVNATNAEGNNFYTNIYLISYNQDAEQATVDIFGRMLTHWKFNSNITGTGTCKKQIGGTEIKCISDDNCEPGSFCTSLKADIVRDTKRLAQITDIKASIENYKQTKGHYPTISSGSYLPNKTVSTWPSWQKTFAKELGLDSAYLDPINKLGNCGDNKFNPETCWDEKASAFAGEILPNNQLKLPAGSNAFIYSSDAKGKSYNMCGVMESGYIIDGNACAGSNVADNHAPTFGTPNLPDSNEGVEYTGYISFSDSDGDNLVWEITSSDDWSNWSPAQKPSLVKTTNATQYKIYYTKSGLTNADGSEKSYNFKITISDGKGGEATKDFSIKINSKPTITVADATFPATSTKPFTFNLTAKDKLIAYPLTYELIPNSENNLLENLNQRIEPTFTPNDIHTFYTLSFSGIVKPNIIPAIGNGKDFSFTIKVKNKFNISIESNFNIKITNNPPIITANNFSTTVGKSITPQTIKFSDAEKNSFSFGMSNLSEGLSSANIANGYQLTGTPTAQTPTDNNFDLIITAADEYGGTSEKKITITITNQKPVINFSNCATNIKWTDNYICNMVYSDADNHPVASFELLSQLPEGLSFNTANGSISGKALSNAATVNPYTMSVRVKDQYGAVSETVSYDLKINSYCGDGVKQSPNTAGAIETCDDGNIANGEGCSSTCQVEPGWVCDNAFPNHCVLEKIPCPITNGTGLQTWVPATATYDSCQVQSCNAGYHANVNQCDANVISCSVVNGAGTRTWNTTTNSYGLCIVASCNAGYHIESGQCMLNTKACTVTNGTGTQIWNQAIGSYGNCDNITCNAAYPFVKGTTLKYCVDACGKSSSYNKSIFFGAWFETGYPNRTLYYSYLNVHNASGKIITNLPSFGYGQPGCGSISASVNSNSLIYGTGINSQCRYYYSSTVNSYTLNYCSNGSYANVTGNFWGYCYSYNISLGSWVELAGRNQTTCFQ